MRKRLQPCLEAAEQLCDIGSDEVRSMLDGLQRLQLGLR